MASTKFSPRNHVPDTKTVVHVRSPYVMPGKENGIANCHGENLSHNQLLSSQERTAETAVLASHPRVLCSITTANHFRFDGQNARLLHQLPVVLQSVNLSRALARSTREKGTYGRQGCQTSAWN